MRVLPPPEGAHVFHLALTVGDFFDDDAGEFLVDIDQHLFDRLHLLAGFFIDLEEDARDARRRLRSLRGASFR